MVRFFPAIREPTTFGHSSSGSHRVWLTLWGAGHCKRRRVFSFQSSDSRVAVQYTPSPIPQIRFRDDAINA
jgi:hypothetical protein